jgi:anti-sigma B factor antagonist
MEIRKELDGDILVLGLSGDFDTTEVENFAAEISGALEAGFFRVLLDLGELRFINSTALGALLTAQKRTAQYGGGVAAANAQPAVEKTLKILGLDQKISLHQHPEGAKSHLNNLSTESVSTPGEEVLFQCPDAEEQFGARARRGRLEKIHDDGLSFDFENLDGLDVAEIFSTGSTVELRFMLPLYHPTHEFKVGSTVGTHEILGPQTVRVHVRFSQISEPEHEAIKQYVKDMRDIHGQG